MMADGEGMGVAMALCTGISSFSIYREFFYLGQNFRARLCVSRRRRSISSVPTVIVIIIQPLNPKDIGTVGSRSNSKFDRITPKFRPEFDATVVAIAAEIVTAMQLDSGHNLTGIRPSAGGAELPVRTRREKVTVNSLFLHAVA